ncbi:MAG: histidine kinase [Xanthobacteraceae bacterium]|nr:histidine kinase [Xanthobacteraceae bacterium]
MISSLRTRLFAAIAAFVLAAGLAAGALAFRWAFAEAIELQDAILLQIGALAVYHRLDTAPPVERGVDAEARVTIEELNPARGDNRPAQLPHLSPDITAGLHTISDSNNRWRILIRIRPDGSRVAIGQTTAYRDEVARDSALRTVLPLAALIPCLMLLVALVINYSFRPVSRLAARLDAKESNHLAKLPIDGMPDELRPFIESINRLLERIARMFEQQRRFVADAAHELRSPITALRLQAENLAHADLPPESHERLAALEMGIRRTAHLLEQLLALAKYESTSLPHTACTPFDKVVKDVVADLLPLARDRSIDLGFKLIEDISIAADATALAVLVRNVVDNAIRHSPDGGQIDISLFREGMRGVLCIEDAGPGIPSNDLIRVFDPFYRGSHAGTQGSGLGLSIVLRIVESLSGSITLENIAAPDRGLRVNISLPVAGAAT